MPPAAEMPKLPMLSPAALKSMKANCSQSSSWTLLPALSVSSGMAALTRNTPSRITNPRAIAHEADFS